MSHVEIKKDILMWAMNRADKSPEVLRPRFPQIQKWLSGERLPTLHQVEDFAKATMVPLGYLFLNEPPKIKLPIPHFRTIDTGQASSPSPNLIDTLQLAQQRQDWVREYLIEQGHEPLEFLGVARNEDDPRKTAALIRRTLGFTESWAADTNSWDDARRVLRDAIEAIGIFVVFNGVVGNNTKRKLNPNEFRGFVLFDTHAPFIFINSADSIAAQMFTMAHELAHVFLGRSAAFDLIDMQPSSDPIEQICNKIAAELLVPENSIKEAWDNISVNSNPYQSLAKKFRVSELVAARRALDLGLISKDKFFTFYNEYREKIREREASRGGGNYYSSQNVRIGKRFADLVIRATQEGKLLYSEAFQLTGLSSKTFTKYTEELNKTKGRRL